MIAAASENNALGKMNWFGVYPISKVQEPHFGHHIIMGRKHSKVFQNHYLTEHML
jgi:hypothetical protein